MKFQLRMVKNKRAERRSLAGNSDTTKFQSILNFELDLPNLLDLTVYNITKNLLDPKLY